VVGAVESRGNPGDPESGTSPREQTAHTQQALVGACGVSVAESALDPPGPIPNPVVTRGSAGEYCGGDPVGGEAVAGTPRARTGGSSCVERDDAGWSSGSSLGS